MIGRQFKRCSRCQQSKPLTAFYRNAGARDGRACSADVVKSARSTGKSASGRKSRSSSSGSFGRSEFRQ